MALRSPDVEIEDLWERIRSDWRFDHLRKTGALLVGGDGSYRPKVMVVGDAPGATEQTKRKAFSGASGRSLRSLMVDVAEVPPGDIWYTYVSKYRLPGFINAEMVQRWVPHLQAEWRILSRPRIIVVLGQAALMSFDSLPVRDIREVAGSPLEARNGTTIWPMLHPRLGQFSAQIRPTMEAHFEAFGEWYREETK